MEKISEALLKFLRLDNFIEHITGYVENRIDLMKIEVREDVSKALARGMVIIALFLMGFLFLIFFSVGLAHFVNTWFNEPYIGFWSVSGVYALVFLLVLAFRKSLLQYFIEQFAGLMKRKAN
jgi:hypothetical protein